MSWSVGGEGIDSQALRRALDANRLPQSDYGRAESVAAMDKAIMSAVALCYSGMFGPGPWRVAINGHSNPGGKPVDNWASDFVTISIYQRG